MNEDTACSAHSVRANLCLKDTTLGSTVYLYLDAQDRAVNFATNSNRTGTLIAYNSITDEHIIGWNDRDVRPVDAFKRVPGKYDELGKAWQIVENENDFTYCLVCFGDQSFDFWCRPQHLDKPKEAEPREEPKKVEESGAGTVIGMMAAALVGAGITALSHSKSVEPIRVDTGVAEAAAEVVTETAAEISF